MENSDEINNNNIHTELGRDLGLPSALAIGVGTMIAAGIFTLSGLAVRNVGSAAILSFLLAAVVATFTALTYCEFVSIYPESGEGYFYARKTFSSPLAYLVGWALFLGYTSSCAFYLSSLSSYYNEFIREMPLKSLSGLVILVGLILLNIKGTKESGSFQIVVTIGKVILLTWFVFGGLANLDVAYVSAKFSRDFVRISSTAAMVFITFFGFSAIAASAGEIRNPVQTIPRAIFISMGIVTLLYTLVILVVVSAKLTEYTEAALGIAAKQFLGPIGGIVIVAGALFSMLSASNASIMAGSRVALSMSRLGHLPKKMGQINFRTRTPIFALISVGVMILIFILSFNLEDLAHFADTVLLLALILVNVALISHRWKYPDLERPFRVPLVPLLPLMAIVTNLYLLSQILHHSFPVIAAVSCLLLGEFVFLGWKVTQLDVSTPPVPPSQVVLEEPAANHGDFRVLVPLANPGHVDQLIELAAAVASKNQGEIVALRVVEISEQTPASHESVFLEEEKQILERARSRALRYQVPITSLIRVGRNVAQAMLETSREQNCDLIMLGWKGYTSTVGKILGSVVDDIVNNARTDVMLIKLIGNESLQKFLLPTAGGAHAQRAEKYIASFIEFLGGSLTVCSVESSDATTDVINKVSERLGLTVARITKAYGFDSENKIITHNSVSDGIIRESENHDAIVIGASGHSIYPRVLFGSIPESIAKNSNKPVILIKYYQPVKSLIGRIFEE